MSKKEKKAIEKRSLDSLFCGIPQLECNRVAGLPVEEMAEVDFKDLRAGQASISVLESKHSRFLSPRS